MKTFSNILDSIKEGSEEVLTKFNPSSQKEFAAELEESSSELGRPVSAHARRGNASYNRSLIEAVNFLADVIEGKRPAHQLREAMTTSDFPVLFGDILDRQVLAHYQETPVSWPSIFRRRLVRDFRTAKYYFADGGDDILEAVNQKAGYKESSLSEGAKSFSVSKYGRRMPFSFETMINDDLDLLHDTPQRFGRAARRSEEKFATGLLVDATGPKSSFFATGGANPNKITDALTVGGLQAAWTLLHNRKDASGNPVIITGPVTLWIPPTLEVTANNIINTVQINLKSSGGTTTEELQSQNWIVNRLKIEIGYYLNVVDESATKNTTWYLVANPQTERPVGVMSFLRGYEAPQIFMKSSNQTPVGGGSLSNPMWGDFDNDSIEYKIRHIWGGVEMFGTAAIASLGDDS